MKINSGVIKSRLKELHKTQKDLAEYLGWHYTSVSQMLHNSETKEETIEKIASFLGCTKEELTLNFTPDKKIPVTERGEIVSLRYKLQQYELELKELKERYTLLEKTYEYCRIEKDKLLDKHLNG
jgi:transcriptional regulator with XRE-family HTH domain